LFFFPFVIGHNEVGHLEPDTIQKLKARSLPDMVKDIKYLHFLYPNLRKDDVFGEYYSPGHIARKKGLMYQQ